MKTDFKALWFPPRIKWHIAGMLIVALAIAISYTSDEAFALGVLLLAFLAYMNTRQFLDRCDQATAQVKRLDQELCRSQNLSNLDELSAGIAHEINNPLGIIAQETQWIQHILKSEAIKNLKEVEDLSDSLREISSQVQRCKEIVHKLLDLAREMEPVIQCVDINELISSLTTVVQGQAQDRNIRITQNLQEDLPFIYTDPPLLRQVVLNLIVNAVHAVEHEGYINVTTARSGEEVQIGVEDSGCGIPKENLNKIFSPFFSTKPQGKGTGLGLAICRGIIERLGGQISVTSEVGECTIFTIHLPLVRGA
jgi:two-component system NtrC family sensor kinase